MIPSNDWAGLPEPAGQEFVSAAQKLIASIEKSRIKAPQSELILGLLHSILKTYRLGYTGGLVCTISNDGVSAIRASFGIDITEALFHLGMWNFEAKMQTLNGSTAFGNKDIRTLN